MASGLQCPGCGHVHPAGLPEIARGDATFRCYGCYRTLSVPEGWTPRPTPRPPASDLTVTGDAPPGAGTRDARSARLAGRGRSRAGALTRPGPAAGPTDLPTQMVPPVTADRPSAPAGAGTGGGAATNPWAPAGPAASTAAARPGAAPLGWVAPTRPVPALPSGIRAGVWAAAFGVGLILTAFILRKMGVLDVNAVIDLYAGSGAGRFGILLVLLPMWALLSATMAHLSLEALAKRRRPSPAPSGPPPDGDRA
jgi:hypothetical protein